MISIAAFKKKRTIEMRCGPGRFKIGIILNWHNIVYRVFKFPGRAADFMRPV